MNINIEVFDAETIENIITCLNFKMDKVIFFGQRDTMDEESKRITKQALGEMCGISDVSFAEVSMKDIDRVLQEITKVVQREEKLGGKCFFDLTGGADTVLVALGMYSATHNIPMHRFDIPSGELRILNTDAHHIDKCVKRRSIPLTIESLVRLQGGVVDNSMQKHYKSSLSDSNLQRDIKALWQVASSNMRLWTNFSSVLKATKTTVESALNEWLDREKVRRTAEKNSVIATEDTFITYLRRLEEAGCIEKLITNQDGISFRYAGSHLRSCLLDAGSVLELHTYLDRLESGVYDECRIGTHLKWGIHAADDGYMVNNEIDVLLQQGYVLTFVSCKAGSPDQMALYELDTVASRFGGKYARKELVTAGEIEPHHRQRAEEMGISVIKV